MAKRAIFYIDGFNFYFGLRKAIELGYPPVCKWLNWQKMAEQIADKLDVISVKYFTSAIKDDGLPGNKEKRQRQRDYISALETQPKIQVVYGNYALKDFKDPSSGKIFTYPVEKKTDVNLTTHLLVDSFQNNCDYAYVVCGDSDIVPAIEAVVKHCPDVKIITCFPPVRYLKQLDKLGYGSYHIKDKVIKKCCFDNKIELKNGSFIECPKEWL